MMMLRAWSFTVGRSPLLAPAITGGFFSSRRRGAILVSSSCCCWRRAADCSKRIHRRRRRRGIVRVRIGRKDSLLLRRRLRIADLVLDVGSVCRRWRVGFRMIPVEMIMKRTKGDGFGSTAAAAAGLGTVSFRVGGFVLFASADAFLQIDRSAFHAARILFLVATAGHVADT